MSLPVPLLFTYEPTAHMEGVRHAMWVMVGMLPTDSVALILPKGSFGRQDVYTFAIFLSRRARWR